MKARPGPELAGRAYMNRFGCALRPGQQLVDRRRRRPSPRSGMYSSSGPPGHVADDHRLVPAPAPCIFARRGVSIVREVRQLGRVIASRSGTHSFCSMPAASPSVPVSTMSMSTRPASCCALILPGSSGAGAWREADAADQLGVRRAVFLEAALRQLQVAGDVDDVQRHRRGRRLGARAGGCEGGEPAGGAEHGPACRFDPGHWFPLSSVVADLCVVAAYAILPASK